MRKKGPFFFSLLCLILFSLGGGSAFAEGGEKVRLSLISGSKTVGKEAKLLLGLHAKIAPGWKVYWRSPGVAGYGMNLGWEKSKNIQSLQILWPLPHRFHTPVGEVNGYEGEVIFPLSLTVTEPQQPVHVAVSIDMLVCDAANCLPIMEILTLDLPEGPKEETSKAAMLDQAMNKVPERTLIGTQTLGTLQVQNVEIGGGDNVPPTVNVVLSKAEGVFAQQELPEMFVEMKGLFVDKPQVSLSKNQKTVHYSAPIYPDSNRTPTHLSDLAGKPVVLTIGYQNRGFEVEHLLKAESFSLRFWVMILLIAFMGGLILNIMPCVLPVLSLKVLSIMRHGGGHNATVRQEFLSTVLGILFSFLLLASGAILLKASGHAVGWGLQFQEPFFLIGLICILTLFSCNLFGFFEFRLPSVLSSLGGISPHRESLLGSFFEGSLVTILATPCTAPFLGTALAFALSRGIPEILSIFTAMGFGLAFPFLLIAFFPKLATKLPKPGTWMITVKYVLGTFVMLTSLWLIYVLIAEIDRIGASFIAMFMALVYVALNKAGKGSEARKKMIWGLVSFLIAISFTLPVFMRPSTRVVSLEKKHLWRPFEPDRIASHVQAGKTVFVNVTADWCLTCQANKYFSLKNKDVLEALHHKDVVAMEADWTNHDPKITAYLKSFNEYGIPFYAVYGCKNPKGKFLGQLLTPQKVLDALKEQKCPDIIER